MHYSEKTTALHSSESGTEEMQQAKNPFSQSRPLGEATQHHKNRKKWKHRYIADWRESEPSFFSVIWRSNTFLLQSMSTFWGDFFLLISRFILTVCYNYEEEKETRTDTLQHALNHTQEERGSRGGDEGGRSRGKEA